MLKTLCFSFGASIPYEIRVSALYDGYLSPSLGGICCEARKCPLELLADIGFNRGVSPLAGEPN